MFNGGRCMISSTRQGWFGAPDPKTQWRPWLIASVVISGLYLLSRAGFALPPDLAARYFAEQDLPILCLMIAAAISFPYLGSGHRWSAEPRATRRTLVVAGALIFAVCLAGHWLVMQAYDLSRDEAMATFAMEQIRHGSLVTPVPAEWQPYGRPMLPLFFNGRIDPNLVWTSGYLPMNSALRALVAWILHPAVTNPLLLVLGLWALWRVARRIWPERQDVAVVVALLGASSSQLIVTAMTSYAMTGHFALNMLWLLLFLRGDRWGIAGALVVGFVAMGLHQFHLHPLFAAPFVLWLAVRRRWGAMLIYGVGYMAMTLFWSKLYPLWLIGLAGPEANIAPIPSLSAYATGKTGRLLETSLDLYAANLARFAAWQNLLLLPLAAAALPILRSKAGRLHGPFLPLLAACVIGLVLLVNQGHGWGYRYLSGLIGCFCLLAGYGWVRLVPEAGPSRAWATVRCALLFTLGVALPLQLGMARSFVAPYAQLSREIGNAPAEVVVVDSEGGFYAHDLVQNGPDFLRRPLVMDLSLLSPAALNSLCRTKTVLRVDRRHFRAAGMADGLPHAELERNLKVRRQILERLDCAPPLAISK
jgi:hypothetical protein